MISPDMEGLLQLIDEYDSHAHEIRGGIESRMYDFSFVLLQFCDFEKHSVNRSGHQIDGKKFAL